MRLDVSYNLCSKLGSKLIFRRNYGNFSFANPFSDFDCIFPSVIFLKVGPDKIYAIALTIVHMRGARIRNAYVRIAYDTFFSEIGAFIILSVFAIYSKY